MKLENLKTVEDLKDFLTGTHCVAFRLITDKDDCYQWLREELLRFRYLGASRSDKGVIIRYLIKISGYSRQHLTRLISQYRETGYLRRKHRTVKGFVKKYSDQDIRLLAQMDERHNTPCGQAIKKLCERACGIYAEKEYGNLANISVSHLYNLRKSICYRKNRHSIQKTKPRSCSIGERRKPQPNGKPGYIRIDTVHQGDMDKKKGVYHINAVDEVTQFEMVFSTEAISERFLIPMLEELLEAFPFIILGFHSDNGSEYINKRVVTLLEKLRIEFTKSRPRRSNDNALAESKNASVVRKIFGYSHIPRNLASLVNDFNQKYLNSYINYHRPCFFPEIHVDSKGKERKIYSYNNMMTPYDKLKSLLGAEHYLKPGTCFEKLDRIALSMSDNQAAERLNMARQELFSRLDSELNRVGNSGNIGT